MNYELRPYQKNAVETALSAFRNRKRSCLIISPTGTGKTTILSGVIERVVNNGGKILFLAHRTSLIEQGAKAINRATGIEVGNDGEGKPITISTVQAMSRDDRLNNHTPKDFALIVIDESHHCPADSYRKVIDYFSYARILGVTATPKRGDNTDVSDLFGEVSSEYTLTKAINDGWLSKIVVKNCPVNIDISKVDTQAGDYAVGEIGEALLPYLDKIADEIIDKAKDRKTIIFVPLVSTAKGMVEIFKSKGVEADFVAGERKDSDKVMERFHNNEFKILINSLLLTEGYDEPSIDCVVNLRPTKSEALLMQIIGRGTRLSPGKDNVLILDFLWTDKDNRNRLSTAGLLACDAEDVPDDLLKDVQNVCANLTFDEETDVFVALHEAVEKAKVDREASLARKLKEAYEREQEILERSERNKLIRETLLNKLSLNLLRTKDNKVFTEKYTYNDIESNASVLIKDNILQMFEVDVFTVFEMLDDNDKFILPKNMWMLDAPSDSQLETLKTLGIPLEYVVSRGYAAELMNVLFKRSSDGLCSYKQAKLLCRYQPKAHLLTKNQAKKALNILAKNKWKSNDELKKVLAV